MARETQSNQARAAAEIRRLLKSAGIKATVRSSSFAGGDSVDVGLIDANPETVKRARDIAAPYRSGYFDGMTDSYVYCHNRGDHPQSKYVHVSVSMTEAMEQRIWDFMRGYFDGADHLPERYAEAQNLSLHGEWVSQIVWRQFSQFDTGFWTHEKAYAPASHILLTTRE